MFVDIDTLVIFAACLFFTISFWAVIEAALNAVLGGVSAVFSFLLR